MIKYNIIGVMSGTSLDGIDIAHLFLTLSNQNWRFEIGVCQTISYPNHWIEKLKKAIDFSEEELTQLNIDYTAFLGKTIKTFIEKNQIKELDAVCSHGHTILHQPKKGTTLQIGNLPALAKIIGEKVVCDFRIQDVQLGGQGAPLVPIGDRLLFSSYDYCLNLGGFSNISFEYKRKRIAFDISPVNTVLNFYANQQGLEYDDKGNLAKSGKLNTELLNNLNEIAYYKKQFPKSLGFEFVKESVLPMIEKSECNLPDKLHTFVEHIAYQTSLAIPTKKSKLFITGGGAYNTFLIERLKFYLPNMEITIPSKKVIEYKEALIFGLLGVLKIRNEINVLSSVTGAINDHCSGIIFD